MTLKDFIELMDSDTQFAVVFSNIPEATIIFKKKPENFENEIFNKQINIFTTYYDNEYVEDTIIGIEIGEK